MARRSGQITARGERTWLVRWFVGIDASGTLYVVECPRPHEVQPGEASA